jgi:RimJ/RimL family protein N-acetyltransferase
MVKRAEIPPIELLMHRPVLETERITLRPLRKQDVPWLVELATDREVRRTTLQPIVAGGTAKATALSEIQMKLTKWAIEDRSTATAVGWIALESTGLPPATGPTVGFEIRRSFWNSGYATAALLCLQEHLFRNMALRCLSGLVFVENAPSRRVFEKAGFQELGACVCRGYDCVEYQLSLAAFKRAMPLHEPIACTSDRGMHVMKWLPFGRWWK